MPGRTTSTTTSPRWRATSPGLATANEGAAILLDDQAAAKEEQQKASTHFKISLALFAVSFLLGGPLTALAYGARLADVVAGLEGAEAEAAASGLTASWVAADAAAMQRATGLTKLWTWLHSYNASLDILQGTAVVGGVLGIGRFATKWWQGGAWLQGLGFAANPLNYTGDDWANQLFGMATTPGIVGIPQWLGINALPLRSWQSFAARGAWGGGLNVTVAGAGALMFNGVSVTDPAFWQSMGVTAALGITAGSVSPVIGPAVGGAIERTRAGQAIVAAVGNPATGSVAGFSWSELSRMTMTLPADVSIAAASPSSVTQPPGHFSVDQGTPFDQPRFQPPPPQGEPVTVPSQAPTPAPIVALGTSNHDVFMLQDRLHAHGIDVPRTGTYDEFTQAGVNRFQYEHGLVQERAPDQPPAVVVDQSTWRALQDPPAPPRPRPDLSFAEQQNAVAAAAALAGRRPLSPPR